MGLLNRKKKDPAKPAANTAEEETPVESKTPEFFLVVTPGLEWLAEAEVKEWFPQLEPKAIKGGVTVLAPLEVGFAFNRCLKTPTRVLVRLADFGCRDFPKLFKKMQNFPWENWVSDQTKIEFEATSRTSRLKMKKRIEHTCADGRMARLKKKGVAGGKGPQTATVLVRFEDDVAWVSLDTSGEILHKRGTRAMTADAPLRENLAASLLLLLESLGAFESGIELVDPMMGGGTFLLEASLLRKPIRTRSFAFEKFTMKLEPVTLQTAKPDPYASFVGIDLDPRALAAASENLVKIGDKRPLALRNEDFFAAKPLKPGKRRWLIVNPPYGERLKVKGGLGGYYEKLLATCEQVVAPERACFLLPDKIDPTRLKAPRGWRLARAEKFSNGGIGVVALAYVIERT